jgi:osmoprotectant transport system substrate-binding protein
MKRKMFLGMLIVLLAFALCLSGCGNTGEEGTESNDEEQAENLSVTVSSKEFTEQLILGEITVQLLEANDFEVSNKTGLGGTSVCREALLNGDIDMYWEYTGTAWMAHLGHDTPITDSEECYQKVKEEDIANGIEWLDYAALNNTYTVMMRKADADELGITSISDLAEAINSGVKPPEGDKWTFATDHEYAIREDGLVGLQELYGFEFDDVPIMQVGITYGALRDGEVTTAMGFATDGRVAGFDLVNLVDDKKFHPVYNGALNVRKDTLEKYPQIKNIIDPVIPLLTDDVMCALNAKVDIEGMEPQEVAQEFLQENGLL